MFLCVVLLLVEIGFFFQGIDIPRMEDLVGFGSMKQVQFDLKPFYKREDDTAMKSIYGMLSASVSNLKATQSQMMKSVQQRIRALEDSGENGLLSDSEDEAIDGFKDGRNDKNYFLGISNYWSKNDDSCLNILVPLCGACPDMLELSNKLQQYISQINNNEDNEDYYASEEETDFDANNGKNNRSSRLKHSKSRNNKREIRNFRIIGIECCEKAIKYFVKRNNLVCEHHSYNYDDKQRLEVYYCRVYKIEILRSNIFHNNVLSYIQSNSIDIVYDCNSFLCINPSERIQYCNLLDKLLRRQNCNILLNTINYNKYYSNSFPHAMDDSDIIQYFGDWCKNILLVNQRVITKNHAKNKNGKIEEKIGNNINKNNRFFNNKIPRKLARFLRKNIPANCAAFEEMWLINVR